MRLCSVSGLVGIAVVVVVLPIRAHCETLPSQMIGKSFILAWTEFRVQRAVGTAAWQNQSESYTFQVYYSPSGHGFSRFTSNHFNAQNEHVGHPSARWQGRTLAAYNLGGKNTRVRQMQITFDQDYRNCDGKITNGKPPGSETFPMKNPDTGQMFEAKSITVTAVSCSVREGNVFAQ